MIGAIICILSLAVANFGSEWILHQVPDYLNAAHITWNQMVAILIYYFLWARD